MRRFPSFGLLLGLIVPAAAAQVAAEPPSVRLTIEEAIDRAEAHSAVLAARRSDRAAALASVSGARALRQPEVDLSASYSRLSEVPELVITGPDFELRSIFPNIPDRYGARLSFSVPLYAGGGIRAGMDSAEEILAAVEAEAETARADLRLETIRAWWELVTSREAERVLGEAMASYEHHFVDARNREELGLAPRNELLAVSVERDRAELAMIRASFAASRAGEDLARLCGFEPGTDVEPTAAPAPQSGITEPLEALIERAMAGRSERESLASLRAAALARSRGERAAARPLVTADGGYDWSNPNLRVLPLEEAWKDTWDVSVRLRWTLWDGRRSSYGAARASAEAEAIAQRLEDLDRRIRLEVTARYLDVREAARALPVAEHAVEASGEAERIARDRYREGLLPSAELLDAETARLQAGLDRTEAAARLAVTRALLERAIGGTLP